MLKPASVSATKKVEIVRKLTTKPARASATKEVEIVRKLVTKTASASATKKVEMPARKLTTKHDLVYIFWIYFISLKMK